MSVKFIVIPLAIMMLVGMMNMAKMGSQIAVKAVALDDGAVVVLSDRTAHQVCYANGTKVAGGEDGTLSVTTGLDGRTYYGWRNATFGALYQLSSAALPTMGLSWVFGGSIGFLAIISAIMVLATLVGIRILGVGISEMSVSTLVKGLAYLSLFLAVASISLSSIQGIPVFGNYVFIGLTFMYTLGMIGQMGHAGGSD